MCCFLRHNSIQFTGRLVPDWVEEGKVWTLDHGEGLRGRQVDGALGTGSSLAIVSAY